MAGKRIWLGRMLVLAFGLIIIGCDNGSTGGGAVTIPVITPPQKVEYESIDTEGNIYNLTITENKANRAVQTGDSYELKITYTFGEKTSRGTVTVKSDTGGSMSLSLTPSGTTISFEVTLSNENENITSISGTITFVSGDNEEVDVTEFSAPTKVRNVYVRQTKQWIEVGGARVPQFLSEIIVEWDGDGEEYRVYAQRGIQGYRDIQVVQEFVTMSNGKDRYGEDGSVIGSMDSGWAYKFPIDILEGQDDANAAIPGNTFTYRFGVTAANQQGRDIKWSDDCLITISVEPPIIIEPPVSYVYARQTR
jgi:hypothetical protein